MAQTRFRRSVAVALVSLFATSLQQDHDPINDFCRRFGHQTAVVDDKLYIDGGLVDWNPIAQNDANYSNTRLLYNELNQTVEGGMPQLYANLSKPSSVPDVSGGILWADEVNKAFHLYGGEYYQHSPEPFTLWTYDILLDQWNQTAPSSQDSSIQRVAWGAGTSVNEIAVGYYLGGWLSNSTVPGWDGPPQMTSNFIRYDWIGNDWTNNTGPDSVGRAEGVMAFLPASDAGLIIYFGGIMDPDGNGTIVGSNMSTIYIYDIASTKWYNQTATGDVPPNRRRFCAGATWPDDQSSYNIYLYGGAGIPPDTTGFDDVYILSLPSFIWIKWWPTQPGPGNPHNSLTCNIINQSQMIIIGGTYPLTDNCGAATVWDTHNLVLGENGPNEPAMWDGFYNNISTYSVPEAITAQIGGSSTGGATTNAPQNWDNRDLPIYFSRKAHLPQRQPNRAIPSPAGAPSHGHRKLNHKGAVIGGAVGGGVLLVALLALLTWCCLRRRRTQSVSDKKVVPIPRKPSFRAELPADRTSLCEAPSDTKLFMSRAVSSVPPTPPPLHPAHRGLPSPGSSSNGYVSPQQMSFTHERRPSIENHHRQYSDPRTLHDSYSSQQQYYQPSQPSPHSTSMGVLPDPTVHQPYPQPQNSYDYSIQQQHNSNDYSIPLQHPYPQSHGNSDWKVH